MESDHQSQEENKRHLFVVRHVSAAVVFFLIAFVAWYAYNSLQTIQEQVEEPISVDEVIEEAGEELVEEEIVEIEEGSIWASVVFETSEGFDDLEDGGTALSQASSFFEDGCVDLYQVVLEEYYVDGGIIAEAVETDEFALYLEEHFPVLSAQGTVVNYLDSIFEQDQVIQSFCGVGDRIFIKALDGKVGYVYEWHVTDTSVGGYLQAYQPVLGVMDGALGLHGELIEGEVVVVTGYGDAGVTWWDYYLLDEATGSSDLIESCRIGNARYSDDASASDYNFVLSCDRQYTP